MSTSTADAVVIGGGAIGASTAFHLAQAGLKHVVLCERRTLASGATGKSAARVQLGESPDAEARITIASLPYYLHWADMVGAGTSGFTLTGYIRLRTAAERGESQKRVEVVRGLGAEARILEPREISELAPYLAIDDVDHAHYQPVAGHASSTATTFAFAERAKELGAEIAEHTVVLGVDVHRGRVTAVRTSTGAIFSPIVIVAAGAWTRPLLEALGLPLPLTVVRTQVAVFRWPERATPLRVMNVSDTIGGYTYFHSEGADDRHLIVGLGRQGQQPLSALDAYDEDGDAAYIAAARTRLVARVPSASYVPAGGGWAGLIAVTPDRAPIIDAHPGVSGLFFATGCSGTGFKGSPAVGRALAEWATHGSPRVVDLKPFRAARFDGVALGSQAQVASGLPAC